MAWRKIEVDGKEYEYRVGFSFTKIYRLGISWLIDLSTLTGKSWESIERGRWKKTTDGMITSKMVEGWIRKNRGAK